LICAAQLHAEPAPPPDQTTTDETTTSSLAIPQHQVQRLIDTYRHATWKWQRVMGRPLTRQLQHPPPNPLEKIASWKRFASRTQRHAQNPPHKRQWLCIHHFEGSWTDPNPPYYGGLQMDLGFMRRYGRALLARKGTANHWTPLEQMWVAERAHRAGRGFFPWPNTARFCGLI
jgi:CubicO group peptidase (beta-lactamase class C family)